MPVPPTLVTLVGLLVALPALVADDPAPIAFRVTERAPGVAAPLAPVPTPDGRAVLRVEGPRFQPVARLHAADDGRPLGPALAPEPPGVSYRITAIAVARDGRTVATAVGNFSNDWGRVDVWDAVTGRRLARRAGLGEVLTLSFAADGRTVAVESGPPGGP